MSIMRSRVKHCNIVNKLNTQRKGLIFMFKTYKTDIAVKGEVRAD